ncbi:hypothetical protein ABOM_006055 [Aspergillus bombycis]|uniref:Uncharacterized protein n=1 Tax=Aspergillus bombycis TaxID=109264 RepID=A0A1F8A3N5_9EURO|nr:hypothetical protein ABOM_006055 [Aspergillus bombycis]OGM45918.1 hypothetical protein ABOM_006055 [Aspergillus bombycis]
MGLFDFFKSSKDESPRTQQPTWDPNTMTMQQPSSPPAPIVDRAVSEQPRKCSCVVVARVIVAVEFALVSFALSAVKSVVSLVEIDYNRKACGGRPSGYELYPSTRYWSTCLVKFSMSKS